MEYCLEDRGLSTVIAKRAGHGATAPSVYGTEVSGKLLILRERQQTVRVTESKCLQRTPKGVRAARKRIGGPLPGAESQSSKERVFDGRLDPHPEDLLHYCLLLGGGDANNRGEGGEGFNTPVCSLRRVVRR